MRAIALVLLTLCGCASSSRLTKAELNAALDVRNAAEDRHDTAGATAADASVSARTEPLAVLISDMSGFTKQARENGIVWFLSQIRRMERVALPLLARHGVELVKQYGDDLFVVSTDPSRLVAFARDFLVAIAAENVRTGQNLRICLGVGVGPVLRVGDDLFGDPVNRAAKLGEDLAEPGELLLTEEVHAALPAEQRGDCARQEKEARNAGFPFYRCGSP